MNNFNHNFRLTLSIVLFSLISFAGFAQDCTYVLDLKNKSSYENGELTTTTISQATPDHWEVKGTNNGPGIGYLEPVLDFTNCNATDIFIAFFVNRTGAMVLGDSIFIQVITNSESGWKNILVLDHNDLNAQSSNISFHGVTLPHDSYTDINQLRIRMLVRSSSNGTPIKIRDGELYISTVAQLPLDLTAFSATVENQNEVVLDWRTENEENVSHFAVQHSTDGQRWTTIEEVEADNETTNFYSTSHLPLVEGTQYYRLMMNDLDGTFTYSDVVSARTTVAMEVSLFPNPAIDKLTVNTGQVTTSTVHIIDSMGRIISEQELDNPSQDINISDLPNGNYFLRIVNGDNMETKPFVKAGW